MSEAVVNDLYIYVGSSDDDINKEELIELSNRLLEELSELDNIESVERVQAEGSEEGAMGLVISTGILVKFAEMIGVKALFSKLLDWRTRDKSRKLVLKIGNNELELTGLSQDEQQKNVEWFQRQIEKQLASQS